MRSMNRLQSAHIGRCASCALIEPQTFISCTKCTYHFWTAFAIFFVVRLFPGRKPDLDRFLAPEHFAKPGANGTAARFISVADICFCKGDPTQKTIFEFKVLGEQNYQLGGDDYKSKYFFTWNIYYTSGTTETLLSGHRFV